MAQETPHIELVEGDVLEFGADVLALKYAQHYYGADEAVSSRLIAGGLAGSADLRPRVWEHVLVDAKGLLPTRSVLFLGVPRLMQFNYGEIEKFGFEAMKIIAAQCPEAGHIAMTLHGPGYGLDEVESLQSEARGIWKALYGGFASAQLRRITILDRAFTRVERLRKILHEVNASWNRLPTAEAPVPVDAGAVASCGAAPSARLGESARSAPPAGPAHKPRIFVAMPFAAEMEDVYFYGIQNPVRRLGFICERIDEQSFTGDVLPQMRARIEQAEIVIADLSGANANVYLEVGYAWGKSRPTVLVIKQENQLLFDVRGQRCLIYKSIKDLETQLINELQKLTGRTASD